MSGKSIAVDKKTVENLLSAMKNIHKELQTDMLSVESPHLYF